MLRGLAREAGHWLDLPQRLQQALLAAQGPGADQVPGADQAQQHQSVQVICIDFPGCGKYHHLPALPSIAAMTAHARAQLEQLSAPDDKSPVIVIGISMGGMVALDWAERYPAELQQLVLINSSTGAQPLWWRLRPAALFTTLAALCGTWRWRERLMLGLVSNDRAHFHKHLRQWRGIQLQRPVSRSNMLAMLLAAARYRPQGQCQVRGLILASLRDRMVAVAASRHLGEAYHWPVHYHPVAGHDLSLDDPDWVISELADWLVP